MADQRDETPEGKRARAAELAQLADAIAQGIALISAEQGYGFVLAMFEKRATGDLRAATMRANVSASELVTVLRGLADRAEREAPRVVRKSEKGKA